MKKIIILKMGDTLESVAKQHGEFPNYIIKKAELDEKDIIVVDCAKDEKLPNIDKIKGIIITGSHSMVTDYEPWSVKISYWLKNVINLNIPILGICYGHQLLADILGGKVGYNPDKMEFGTWDIYLTKEGKKDKLLGILPEKFKGHEAHFQSVLEIPEDLKILAYNENDSTQSFVYKDHIWGVQFHPEFLADITKQYLKFVKDDMISSGKDYENIFKKVEEDKYGQLLLKRFVEIVDEYNR
ncbi:glutamine amidotransferase [Terrisporobacter sp.]